MFIQIWSECVLDKIMDIDIVWQLMNKVKPPYYYRYLECLDWYGKDVFYCVGLSNKITMWSVGNNGRCIEQET